MPVNVNLLPNLEKKDDKKKKFVKIFNFIAIGLFMVTVLTCGGAFAVKSITDNSYKSVSKEIGQKNALIKQNEAVAIKLAEVKSRASSVDSLLNGRKSYYNFMTNIENITPKKIAYESLSIEANNSVTINGKCSNYDELLGFVQAMSGDWKKINITNPPAVNLFTDVKLLSASRDATNGDIRFSVSCTATEGAFNVQ